MQLFRRIFGPRHQAPPAPQNTAPVRPQSPERWELNEANKGHSLFTVDVFQLIMNKLGSDEREGFTAMHALERTCQRAYCHVRQSPLYRRAKLARVHEIASDRAVANYSKAQDWAMSHGGVFDEGPEGYYQAARLEILEKAGF